jgi:hypothetical protein
MEHSERRRTTEHLQRHLTRCNNCKNTISFCYKQTGINSVDVIKTFFHCNSYFCETCAHRKMRKLMKKWKHLKFNGRLRFLTLTLSTEKYTPEQSVLQISALFNDFVHRMRDRGFRFQYFKIVELTKKHEAHLHVLVNCYMDKDIVKDVWERVTDCYVKCIEEVKNKEKAVEYLVKYMTKAVNSSANYLFFLLCRRRYSYSQSFFAEMEKVEKFIKSFIHFYDEEVFMHLLNKFLKRRFFNSKLLTVNILNHWQDYKISYS